MLTPYKIIDVITCPFNNAPHLFHRDNKEAVMEISAGTLSEYIVLDIYNDAGEGVDSVTISWDDNYTTREALATAHEHFKKNAISDFQLANLVIYRRGSPCLWMCFLPL